MKLKIKFVFLFLVLAFAIQVRAQDNSLFNIIPLPAEVIMKQGVFEIDNNTYICINVKDQYSNAIFLNEYLKKISGFELKIWVGSIPISDKIIFLNTDENAGVLNEGYTFSVNEKEIRITSINSSGVFYGLQTLFQLIQGNTNNKIPCLEIKDYPRFKWRGMHLDVCRHFFPKEFVKKYIDYIAMYKMNTFHWHLTDDQGWRIEIKKYPKLTEIGAWRKGTLIGSYREYPHKYDTITYGGFYTQEDIKEIVEYAAMRNVTIVPEIEMPGHSLAALASYPELSCTGGPFDVAREWGTYEDVYCPKEEIFKFLEDVLTEVMELFPGKYIHIGGDEVPKDIWKKCKNCQELIKREGLKDENGLQSYFIKRIEKFINSKGKTLIGWDEILEGGLAPNATVMSWRGTEGGIDAAKQNHDVVMTPGGYCYFDHYQGDPRFEPLAIGGYTTVEKVYSYEPIPSELNTEEQNHILGAQGNVWTEYIDSPQKVEYMVFPRICALSEVLWTPSELKNYPNFKSRLLEHFKLLSRLNINYSKAIFDIKTKVSPNETNDGVLYKLTPSSDYGEIYYTLDGSEPSLNSSKYTLPIEIKNTSLLKAAYFENGEKKGNTIQQQFYVDKSTGKKIKLLKEPHRSYNTGGAFTLVDGIKGRRPWYGKEWLGFLGEDMEAEIDLGSIQYISSVDVGMLNEEYSWIYLPKKIEIFTSSDGLEYTLRGVANEDEIQRWGEDILVHIEETKARFVKVKVQNFGKIPEGKPGAGNDAWLFVDEIFIK
ncbi:MAG TPA: family 20 glycosylhydrolase [Ignavibacteria bacterium]